MTFLKKRPRSSVLILGTLLYLVVGLTFTDLDAVVVSAESMAPCPAGLLRPAGDRPASRHGSSFLEARPAAAARATPLTVLQGNLWMLPSRPLILPYDLSTDREERLERLVGLVRSCRPMVVALQEVFDAAVVEALRTALPGYDVHASGITDAGGSVNTSGLLTLTRIPARARGFHPFPTLAGDAKVIERLGRKGFLVTEIAVPGLHATIVNAHLYAGRGPEEEGHARAQLANILRFVDPEERAGRTVFVTGDFNLEREMLGPLLPEGWTLSQHGPTYHPGANPYTVRGANNTPGNHLDRDLNRRARAIDFLAARRTAVEIASEVLAGPILSDHQFLVHRITPSVAPREAAAQ